MFKCRGCKESKDRNEFHPLNFDNTLPRKLCWECDKRDAVEKAVIETKISMEDEIDMLNETISKLGKKIRILERQNNISVVVPNNKPDEKLKHKNLNVYMEPDNKQEAWFKHKGSYRMYKTFPNRFVEGDVCIVVQRPYGGKKYYGLQQMYKWITEEETPTYKIKDKKKVEAPF